MVWLWNLQRVRYVPRLEKHLISIRQLVLIVHGLNNYWVPNIDRSFHYTSYQETMQNYIAGDYGVVMEFTAGKICF
jgi:hypothetical protein